MVRLLYRIDLTLHLILGHPNIHVYVVHLEVTFVPLLSLSLLS